MAKSVSLTSLDTVWCTTYLVGEQLNTRFDISMQLDADTQVTATFTTEQLRDRLMAQGSVYGLAKPEFD